MPTEPHGAPRGGRTRRPRRRARSRADVETLVIEGGQHSWLYEDAGYRRRRRRVPGARPGRAARSGRRPADLAEATHAERIPDVESSVRGRRGRRRAGCARWPSVALPGATRPPRSSRTTATARRHPGTTPAGRRASRERPATMRRPRILRGRDRLGSASIRALRRPAARARPPRPHPAAPADAPAAARTCSAGRSSSAAIGRTCEELAERRAVGRPPGRGRRRDRARHARSRGARPGRRRCRSCSTSGRPPRT